jgi:uncharacterized protein (TIGR03086 family)
MDPKSLFKQALEQATATIKWVDKRHYKNTTPCTEWNCKVLLNHMLYELSWVPDMLAGKTIAQVGTKYDGDLLGKDHIANWQKAANKAVAAVNKTKLDKKVHLSYGDVSASQYINEVGADLLIHSWDADQSISCSLILEPHLAKAVYDHVYPRRQEYASSGIFGTPFEVPENSRLQVRLLALVGRREPEV